MKKLITIFSFLILTSTVFANSVGGSIGGWQVISNVGQGIGAKLTATKDVMINGASKTLSATANITPNPTNVAKFLVKAGGLVLADIALRELMNGVDFVLDPANNAVIYKNKPRDTSQIPNTQIYFQEQTLNTFDQKPVNRYFAPSETAAMCSAAKAYYPSFSNFNCKLEGNSFKIYNGSSFMGTAWTAKANSAYNPSIPDLSDQPKSVPISAVASTVIDQAEKDIKAGNPASSAVALSRAVAQDMVTEAKTDDVKARPISQQLEQNQTYPTSEDATGTIDTPAVTDPVTGEVVKPAETASVALKFPKACEWFPQLCVFIDWMQKDPELDENLEVPTEEKAKKEINENLVKIASSTCPAPYPVEINLPVLKTTYTDSIDISPYCPEIEKLAPVLQLLAFVLAVMIIKDI